MQNIIVNVPQVSPSYINPDFSYGRKYTSEGEKLPDPQGIDTRGSLIAAFQFKFETLDD